MKALITGASSGIGKSFALYLKELGYDLILVAKDKSKLSSFAKEINSKYYVCDLSNVNEVKKLYDKVKSEDIDILINNAGFGQYGEFNEVDLDIELNMINVNICAVHILTKLFLKDFIKRDSGYILNVASSASFMPGPLMSTYYSTKSYVYKMSISISEELRHNKSNVHISVLCPGPVDTNFNNVAGVKFKIKSTNSEYVSKYAIDKMLRNKLVIIPTLYMKLGILSTRFLNTKLLLRIGYKIQSKKRK